MFPLLQTLVLLAITGIVIALLVERNKQQTPPPPQAAAAIATKQPEKPAQPPTPQQEEPPKPALAKQTDPPKAKSEPPPESIPADPTTPEHVDPAVTPEPVYKLFENVVTVPPRRDSYITFRFRKLVTISGHFTAEGGWGNDIRVIITDPDGFANMQNRHAFTAFYDSGKVTAGTIATVLRPGDYYVVFSNTDSLVSNKVVRVTIFGQ